MECLGLTEILSLLQSDILNFGFNSYFNISQIHWYLVSYDRFLVIGNFQILIFSAYFSFACCCPAFQIDFDILQECNTCFTSIDFQSGSDENGGLLAHQHLLTIHMELGIEVIIFTFLLEFGELGETIVDHDNFAGSLILSIRDENSPILF